MLELRQGLYSYSYLEEEEEKEEEEEDQEEEYELLKTFWFLVILSKLA